ncbi:MAG TPA: N-acetylmuramoyl-L-alanine amidase [Polyangia bacterium]|nr:N-acetylmuramoyl-L-alanine amidase [Polyangia bacterium]
MIASALTAARVAAAESPAEPVVVAIDPGHGGTNLGASGPGRGVHEKVVTLALAERVRALLTDEAQGPAPRVSVVLCRTTDDFVPIRARSRCAREAGARLFLSLHANAVPVGVTPGTKRGFEVFVLGPREIEDDAALAALSETDEVAAVWRAHAVRASGEASIALAQTVAEHLTEALGADANRGVKQSGAALDVLRGVETAAALVEIGFLDHPEEGGRLANASSREPIARALAAGIQQFARSYAGSQPMPRGRAPSAHQRLVKAAQSVRDTSSLR